MSPPIRFALAPGKRAIQLRRLVGDVAKIGAGTRMKHGETGETDLVP
jgi:hypothetical protein